MKNTIIAAAMGALVTALFLSFPTPSGSNVGDMMTARAAGQNTYRQLDLFGEVFDKIRSEYVDEVDDDALIEGAVRGMMSSLDPHSSYMNLEEYESMQVSTRGEFGGLGIEVVQNEAGGVRVVSPIDDTPASRAGIQTDDIITHVDGESIIGTPLNEAIKMMRGPANTDITISIARGDNERFDVSLTRAIITIESVRHRVIEDNIGYIRISTFSEKTESGMHKAMAALKRELGDGMAGIVLDLRSNPGGLLHQAVAVTDFFVDNVEIVSVRSRHEKHAHPPYRGHDGDLAEGKPVVVLINGGSASASEIVAGALKDYGRATLVGTKSFGKGSVQNVLTLSNRNNGALRLTTAKYYTPSGESIHGKGIEPDIHIELVIPEAPAEGEPRPEIEDIQLDKAVEVIRGTKTASIQ